LWFECTLETIARHISTPIEALVEIDTLAILRGELPRRGMALVLEWAALHRQKLRADWERARGGTPLESIAPLD
jgi:hypothetical protein